MFEMFFGRDEIKERISEIEPLDSTVYEYLLERTELNKLQRIKKTARQTVRRHLARGALREFSRRKTLKEIINNINQASGKKKILYISVIPTFNLVRQSIYLRKTGEFETILLTETPWLANFMEKYFDAVYVYDSRFALAYILKEVKPFLIHVQGTMCSSDYYGVLASLLSKSKIVFEFFDVTSLSLSKEDAIGVYGKVDAELSFFSERFIFDRCDGIIIGYSQQACQKLKSCYCSTVPVLEFHSYICDEFVSDSDKKYSDADGNIHLVYGGNVARSNSSKKLFGDVQFRGLIEKITQQGICFDIYHSPHLSRIRAKQFLSDYIQLSETIPLFNFKSGLPPDEATKEFARYDFGAMIYLFGDGTFLDVHNRTRLPGKVFTYLEAGLPILISEELQYPAKLIRDYEVGIVISQKDLDNLPKIIECYDYEKLKANVKKARRELFMGKHIGRLIEFYNQIAEVSRQGLARIDKIPVQSV